MLKSIYAFLVLTLALLSTAALAAAPQFLRVSQSVQSGGEALQVAITRYEGKRKGRTIVVDLVSAVHVGDADYYRELNERFEDYDVVLYELVAEADQKPKAGEEPDGAISGLQHFMKDALDLSYQLDVIDYRADNFVHADFSPDELSADMEKRGESAYSYFWRMFYAASRQSARDPFGVKQALRMQRAAEANPEKPFKVAMAYEFVEQTRNGEIMVGEQGSALIEGRNNRALEVLVDMFDKGHRRIAIFYGAGHMPDFDERLTSDFELNRTSTDWVDAWRLQ